MVRIRLRREGKKGQPTYRIVVAEKEMPRDGRFLEILGHYNPRTEPSTISIKEDRVYAWISKGAQPSDSVAQLFRQIGTQARIDRFKAGEDLETLLKEAALAQQIPANASTSQKSPAASKKKSAPAEE